jgi:uracil DNA glycosylase
VIQRLAQFRTNRSAYAATNGFTKLLADLAANTITLDTPTNLYDAWENQGAIFLNKVLTYTLPSHVEPCHGVFWLPVVSRIVERLAKRSTGQVVFAMWGSQPAALKPIIRNAAIAAGTWNTRVKILAGRHPATASFLSGTNPFRKINNALASMGGTPLTW